MTADASAHGPGSGGAPAIRPIEQGDAAAVARLARSARFSAIPGLPDLHTPQEDLAFYAGQISSECGLVAIDAESGSAAEGDADVVGFIMWRGEIIEHLYVLPSHQSTGIGTALLAGACDRMPGERVRLWTFQANVNAVGFYLRRGFRIDRSSDGEENEECLPDFLLTRARQAPSPVANGTSLSSGALLSRAPAES